MVTRDRTIFTTLLAVAVGSLTGFSVEGLTMNSSSSLAFFGIESAHPILFWMSIGFFVAFIGNQVIGWVARAKGYEQFFEVFRAESTGRARSELFNNLGYAYEKWKIANGLTQAPAALEDLIEQTPIPPWLPIKDGELIEVVQREFSSSPPLLWRLSKDLYMEIDDFLKGRIDNPTLMRDTDVKEFHYARQRLSYFYDDVGDRVFRRGTLRYHNIRRDVRADARLLKTLMYLGIGLHFANKQKGTGHSGLYYLCAVQNGTITRGFFEWIRDPLPLRKYK